MDGRERLISEGPAALSDHDLLSVVLGSGNRFSPVSLVAARLLSRGLPSLRRTPACELQEVPGVGPSQACRVAAALELGRRATFATPRAKRRLVNAQEVSARLWMRLAHLGHEEFWVLLLTARLEELRSVRISSGGLSQCSVLPREAFRPALLLGAPCVAFAHNHPSGDPSPSGEDLRLQLHLEEAGRALGVRVVDHLVLAETGIHSSSEGLLPPPPPPADDDADESLMPPGLTPRYSTGESSR